MNIAAMILAANGVAKPTAVVVGNQTFFVRRCTAIDRAEFLEHYNTKPTSAQWVVAFGLATEDNKRVYEDPETALEIMRTFHMCDLLRLEQAVLVELGLDGGDDAKKA